MTILIKNTKNIAKTGAKVLVFSPPGFGKTRLCSTVSDMLIISAESGLLSLDGEDCDYIDISNFADLDEAYQFVKTSNEMKKYEHVGLDSISEIAEIILTEYKAEEIDARQAYGRLNDDVGKKIRQFRDLQGKNVYFSAKQASIEDPVTKVIRYKASMPGKALLRDLPHAFDEIFSLQIGLLEDGSEYHFLQTHADFRYDGKDRSGKLDPIEPPDLDHIFRKIAAPHGTFISKYDDQGDEATDDTAGESAGTSEDVTNESGGETNGPEDVTNDTAGISDSTRQWTPDDDIPF